MILLIDNYDSFAYNLYQLIGSVNPDIEVYRNDKITIKEIEKLNPDYIVISPGPGRAEDAGVSIEVIKRFHKSVPILGICLGHQAICEAYGGIVTYAKDLIHGKSSNIKINNDDEIFKGLNTEIVVGRYHSLSIDSETIPKTLKVLSISDDKEIMAIKDENFPVYGLQFHPESILTPDGEVIIKNFLKMKKN